MKKKKRKRAGPAKAVSVRKFTAKAWARARESMQGTSLKKLLLPNLPFLAIFYAADKCSRLYRYCTGRNSAMRLLTMVMNIGLAFRRPWPSFFPQDLLAGVIAVILLKAYFLYRKQNAKKFRKGEEYGSARWGTAKDIEPFIDPVFENNILLTQTERLTMSSRPKLPKNARNKNVIVIGGSGSGKTRFYVKPNLMQMPGNVSYVVTDPKISIRAILIPEHYILKGSSGYFYTQL